MYKVEKEFNDYKVGDVITLKIHTAKSLIADGYISKSEEPTAKPKSKDGKPSKKD